MGCAGGWHEFCRCRAHAQKSCQTTNSDVAGNSAVAARSGIAASSGVTVLLQAVHCGLDVGREHLALLLGDGCY